jgi:hypothetical protein
MSNSTSKRCGSFTPLQLRARNALKIFNSEGEAGCVAMLSLKQAITKNLSNTNLQQ